jgi:hypothetical protein
LLRILKEDKDSKSKIKRINYSLTEKAKREYYLNILGNDESSEERKKFYQLLFFFEIYGTDNQIEEKELDEFLAHIPATRNDLVVDYVDDLKIEGTPIITSYNSIRDINILYIRIPESKYHKARNFYNIKLPGFSISDFVDPESFRHLSFPLPFDYIRFTRSYVEDALDPLLKEGLIVPIMSFMGEIRYSFTNERVRNLIERIYAICEQQRSLIEENWSYRKSTEEERTYHYHVLGKRRANDIINYYFSFRQRLRKEDKNWFRTLRIETEKSYENKIEELNERIRNLKQDYDDILSRCPFILDREHIFC